MILRTVFYVLCLLPIVAVSHSFASDMEIIYYHNDTLGSPRAATDENGEILWRENYAPYGKKLANEASEQGNHIGYTGKPHERITGFTYLNARYYDPVIGRFMAVDPVEYMDNGALHFQRYSYAYNNPYKYTDPSGEAGILAAAGALLTLAGFVNLANKWSEQVEAAEESEKKAEEMDAAFADQDYGKGISTFRDFKKTEQKKMLEKTFEASQAAAESSGNSISGGIPTTEVDLEFSAVAEAINRVVGLTPKKKTEVTSLETTTTGSEDSDSGDKSKVDNETTNEE